MNTPLDRALEASGYVKADTLWHLATDALLERNYARFDALMREFRATTKHWRGPALPNKRAGEI